MNVTKLWSCGPAHDGGGDGGGEAQDVTYVETADRVWEGRCIRIKTIEKMLISLPQISKISPAARSSLACLAISSHSSFWCTLGQI